MLILALLLLLLLAASFGVYRFVLYSPLGAQNVPQHLPTGEQYDPKHDLMVSLIEELLALPHELAAVNQCPAQSNRQTVFFM